MDLFAKKKRIDEKLVRDILATAGIEVNGKNPWDIQVHDDRFYGRILKNTSVSVGESYMDGWWDASHLDELYFKVMVAHTQNKFMDYGIIFQKLKSTLLNLQSLKRSNKVAKVHYDLDYHLYAHMLGESMAYTCAYWKDAKDLNEAQNKKYDLICRKMSLSSQDYVLELGCGWGGFAKFAAENYGTKMVIVNISNEQVKFAQKHCADLPIEVYQADYRDVNSYNPRHRQFDKVISIGMCEHIGHKNYSGFMQIVSDQMKDDGLFLLHTIGNNKTYGMLDPWFNKYIFPNGEVPSIAQLGHAMEPYFVMEDWHNFGADYDKTLMAWHENFIQAWPILSSNFDERFYRMWVYYLLSCAGAFRAREMQLWQIILSKGCGVPGYQRPG